MSASMLQEDHALSITNLTTPIRISLPYRTSGGASSGRRLQGDAPPCVGMPMRAAEAATCSTIVECRFWNASEDAWSTAGCMTTMAADGSIGCSCTHLTEFVAFEFPTSADDLLALALSAVRMNTLSARSFECAFNPSRAWRSIPAVWGCLLFLLVLFSLLLFNAVYHDRKELSATLALVAGKKRDEQKRATLMRGSTRQGLTRQRSTFTRSLTRKLPVCIWINLAPN